MSSKYEFIDAEKAYYPVVKMCAWMEVSTSGFYEWRGRPASATAARREQLELLITRIFDDSAPIAALAASTAREAIRASSFGHSFVIWISSFVIHVSGE